MVGEFESSFDAGRARRPRSVVGVSIADSLKETDRRRPPSELWMMWRMSRRVRCSYLCIETVDRDVAGRVGQADVCVGRQ
jgi:hypothetical protein